MNKRYNHEQQMIQDVMDNFDWVKCHRTMTLIGWEWYFVGIPSITDLKDCASKLFQNAIEGVKKREIPPNSYYYSATGGLKATAWKNRFNQITQVELEFILTSWDSDGDYSDDNLQKKD